MGSHPAVSESPSPASLNNSDNLHALSDDAKILHLLNRATFGPQPGDLDRARRTGVEAFLDEQLHPEKIDDSAVEARVAALPTLAMSSEELVENYPQPKPFKKLEARPVEPPQKMAAEAHPPAPAKRPGPPSIMELQGPRRVIMELAQEEVLRALESRRQLQEMMVQFWMNHFNIFVGKGADKWLLTSFERDTIRPRALGNFEDLLVATAQSPAMLFYLDNWLSSAPNPQWAGPRAPFERPGAFNRPFAMRGFGPRRGPFAAARMNEARQMRAQRRLKLGKFARRGINENYGRELMELHTLGVDGGYTQKDVIEVARCLTGWTIDKPRLGGGFIFRPQMHDEGSKIVLGHKFKAGRGIEDGYGVLHLLAHHPSTAHFISTKLCRRFVADDPPPSVVERASNEFTKTHGDLRAVVKSIFTSPEFNSPAAYQSKVKSPMELAASMLRALGAKTEVNLPLLYTIGRMGEPMFQYQAPSGFPDRANTWIDTGSLLNRINFAMIVATSHFPGVEAAPPDFDAGVTGNESAVDLVSSRLLGRPLAGSTRQSVLKSLARSPAAGPWGAANASRPDLRLVASLVLASPDFQRK